MREIFVAGTDTGVGKTLVSAALTLGLNAEYFKPIQSGLEEETDTEFIARLTSIETDRLHQEAYRLNRPLSPHLAARLDGITIDLNQIKKPEHISRPLVIEGAGGLLVPLNDSELLLDLMVRFQAPVLLVARSGLGTINHTLLSLKTLNESGLEVLGVIMNGEPNLENKNAIEYYGKVKVLGCIEPIEHVTKEALMNLFESFEI